MKASDMIPSKYLRSDDIEGETVVTIKKIGQVGMKEKDGSETQKWAVKFEECPQPLVLNKTNIKRLEKFCGADTDEWPGKKVVLYVDHEVQFGSDIVSALRIKAHHGATKVKGTPGTALSDMDDDVPFLYNTSTVFNAMLTAPSTSWERAKHGKKDVQNVRRVKASLGVLPAQDDGRWASE